MILTEQRRVDLGRTDPAAVLGLLRFADLRGHGGAGFPTATKIESAQGGRPRLIVNACDGEPLIDKDAAVLRHAPGLLTDGLALVAAMVGARQLIIAVHAGSPAETDARVLAARAPLPVEILAVPHRYVSSEASALASLAAGGQARPVTHDLPLTHGGPGRHGVPVLVLNAETVARVAGLWLDGGYAPATRLITLAGAIARPGLVEVDATTPVGDLIHGAGAPAAVRAVLLGGYGGRWVPWAEAESRTLAELGPDLGAGLIMVQGADCPLPVVGAMLDFLAEQSAGQCGPCMFGLPAIAADWRELAHPATARAARERLHRRLPVIDGGGACRHPDGTVRMAASALATFDSHLRGHADHQCNHPFDDEAAASYPRLELSR